MVTASFQSGQAESPHTPLSLLGADEWPDLLDPSQRDVWLEASEDCERRPSFFDFAGERARDDEHTIRRGEIRAFGDRFSGKIEAITVSSGDEARRGADVVGDAGIAARQQVARTEARRRAAMGQRFLSPSQVATGKCENVICDSEVRIEAERLFKLLDGVSRPPAPDQRAAVQDPEFKAAMDKLETHVVFKQGEDFRKFFEADARRLVEGVRKVGRVETK